MWNGAARGVLRTEAADRDIAAAGVQGNATNLDSQPGAARRDTSGSAVGEVDVAPAAGDVTGDRDPAGSRGAAGSDRHRPATGSERGVDGECAGDPCAVVAERDRAEVRARRDAVRAQVEAAQRAGRCAADAQRAAALDLKHRTVGSGQPQAVERRRRSGGRLAQNGNVAGSAGAGTAVPADIGRIAVDARCVEAHRGSADRGGLARERDVAGGRIHLERAGTGVGKLDAGIERAGARGARADQGDRAATDGVDRRGAGAGVNVDTRSAAAAAGGGGAGQRDRAAAAGADRDVGLQPDSQAPVIVDAAESGNGNVAAARVDHGVVPDRHAGDVADRPQRGITDRDVPARRVQCGRVEVHLPGPGDRVESAAGRDADGAGGVDQRSVQHHVGGGRAADGDVVPVAAAGEGIGGEVDAARTFAGRTDGQIVVVGLEAGGADLDAVERGGDVQGFGVQRDVAAGDDACVIPAHERGVRRVEKDA